MDHSRFDRLARSIAARGSRRAALRGLAAAIAVSLTPQERATANADSIPLGGACYHTRQCRDDYAYCDDNGFAYDGEFNCCRYEGGFCRLDEHCCGTASCINDACGYYQPVPVSCQINGQPCQTDYDCCGTDVCYWGGAGIGSRCTQFRGGPCRDDAGCAGNLVCLGGYCGSR